MKLNKYTKEDLCLGDSIYNILDDQLVLLDEVAKVMFPVRPPAGTPEWDTLRFVETMADSLNVMLNKIAVWDEED